MPPSEKNIITESLSCNVATISLGFILFSFLHDCIPVINPGYATDCTDCVPIRSYAFTVEKAICLREDVLGRPWLWSALEVQCMCRIFDRKNIGGARVCQQCLGAESPAVDTRVKPSERSEHFLSRCFSRLKFAQLCSTSGIETLTSELAYGPLS